MAISLEQTDLTQAASRLPVRVADTQAVIGLRGVTKEYPTPAGSFQALKDIDLSVAGGEFVGIIGRSGSGKSTLLNLLAGIDRPTTGEIWIAGSALHRLSENQVAVWRGRSVGVVFQFFQLLPTLTVLENVLLPMDFAGCFTPAGRYTRAMDLLAQVGVADQAGKLPAALSGGQQQRAAIARALANDPPLLVADEPTGNLDLHNAGLVLDFFRSLAESGKTVVVVTHERDIDRYATRLVQLQDGVIVNGAQDPAEAPYA